MENLILACKEISEKSNHTSFIHEDTREIWISGYKNDRKFDLFIKKLLDGTFKLIYEIPEERKVTIFLDEDKLINRLKKIFLEVVESK